MAEDDLPGCEVDFGDGTDEPLVDGKELEELDFWNSNFCAEEEEDEELFEVWDFLEAGPAVIPGLRLMQ